MATTAHSSERIERVDSRSAWQVLVACEKQVTLEDPNADKGSHVRCDAHNKWVFELEEQIIIKFNAVVLVAGVLGRFVWKSNIVVNSKNKYNYMNSKRTHNI